MTELVNFIFHIMKISNFRHKLAFKQVVRFYSPSVYKDTNNAWCKSAFFFSKTNITDHYCDFGVVGQGHMH